MSNNLEIEKKQKLISRDITSEQFEKYASYIKEIFTSFGMDVDTESTKETPRRFLDALYEITNGYDGDPKLVKAFTTECSGSCKNNQIIQGPIKFYSLCEHHGLPVFGNAYIGYIANENIIGISKLTRLVRLFSNRFSVQERVGEEIADLLQELVDPSGIAVYIEARHLCMEMRGAKGTDALTKTTVFRNKYSEDSTLRGEFLNSCR